MISVRTVPEVISAKRPGESVGILVSTKQFPIQSGNSFESNRESASMDKKPLIPANLNAEKKQQLRSKR